jgi:hypothetical protein
MELPIETGRPHGVLPLPGRHQVAVERAKLLEEGGRDLAG